MNNRKSACWEMALGKETDGRQRGAVRRTSFKGEEKARAKYTQQSQWQVSVM